MIAIDAAGHHRLVVERDGRVRLEHDAEHRRSDLRWALLRCLEVSGRRLDPDTESVHVEGAVEVHLAGRPLVRLTPFETRYLADNQAPHPATGLRDPLRRPCTDLHTHFAGCVRPTDLLELGARLGAVYPPALLERAGIRAPSALAVSDMSPEVRAKLETRLAIPTDRQLTFAELQAIYRLRQPITKLERVFVPMARRIAEDYAAMGARYVELSLHQIAETALLEAAQRELPRIEAETGVTLRFLAAFGRDDDEEWIRDYLDRVVAISGSRYITGVDVMGHEVSSTHVFAPVLRDFAQHIGAARPGFVIRVHAGENAAHPENVRVAAESVRGTGVALRVGHGLYGADDATLAVLGEVGAVVEFNLDSNFALNNLQTFAPESVPLVRYLAAGIPAVLGTDGYGVYQTTLEEQARAAAMCGLDEAALARVCAVEEAYVARRRELDATRSSIAVPTDPGPSRFGPAVEARKRAALELRDRALAARLEAIGVSVLDRAGVDRLLRKRRVVSFAGAWRKSWASIGEDDRRAIRDVACGLLDAWDPARVVLLTGGTRHGLEALVQREARARGFTIVGVLVKAISPDDLEPGAITQAVVIGETIYDKAGGLYRLVKDHDGWCLFFGGGPTVGDEIQTADNLHLPHLLMDGPPGASTEHARQQPSRAFRTAADVLAAMAADRSPGRLRHLGPNPAVDVIAIRGGREVLLVRRADQVRTFPGAWALPGGFVKSASPPGAPWTAAETLREAALRELREETGLDAGDASLVYAGMRERGGRDPRDSETSWVRATAFVLELDERTARAPIAGGDDAGDARWWPLDALPPLAFDHAAVVAAALLERG